MLISKQQLACHVCSAYDDRKAIQSICFDENGAVSTDGKRILIVPYPVNANQDLFETEESKADAEEKKLALITQMEKELVTEGIIRGKGFEDVVITTSNSNINVFIKASELTESEVAQITSVVTTQMNVEIDKIIIIPSE